MIDRVRGDAWRFIYATFPERQIYIRSDGRVQFFTFSPMMQAIMAGVSLLFLGWVAFTSVNTIFKDRIIAAKEAHFRQMQTSYERRITDLQVSYDLLNTALVTAEDRFRAVASELEAKHRTLAAMLERRDVLEASLGIAREVDTRRTDVAATAGSALQERLAEELADDGADILVPDDASALVPAASARPLNPLPRPSIQEEPREANPAIRRPGQQTFLRGAVQRLGALFQARSQEIAVNHPILRRIAAEEARLRRLLPAQTILAEETERVLADATQRLERTMRMAGVDPAAMTDRAETLRGGVGGPYLPLGDPADEDTFAQEATEAQEALENFVNLAIALQAVPLQAPVAGENFWQSSSFGRRRDPFTKQLAFHAGIDFSGPSGSPVVATAPGEVVFAGPRGAYGNTVEIDHGFGIRTRYGHLARIEVPVGAEVDRGETIGRMGSTGRSTGPHVHYEVWYDDRVRNPYNFLKAGRYVYEE